MDREGIFSIKLYELSRQFALLQSRLQLAQTSGHRQIQEGLQEMTKEWEENELILKNQMSASRSPAAARLAKAQAEYCENVKDILNRFINEGDKDEKPEAAALYAEYAADFAIQAMRQALLAAYFAIDVQMTENEEKSERGTDHE